MMKMVVIADDITGALDTCVKFVTAGATARVYIGTESEYFTAGKEEILCLCVPSRHVPPQEAYEMIKQVTRQAVEAGAQCIFKKTDSALRGNVAAELNAVLDGSKGSTICFIPAFPAMKRTTEGGVHYIDGVPVAKSVFGYDPFDPVRESSIPKLLVDDCGCDTRILSGEDAWADCGSEKSIRIFDCASREDMNNIVAGLKRFGTPRLLAGCAGLAEGLAAAMTGTCPPEETDINCRRLMVACGSVNPITRVQLDYAQEHGFIRRRIPGRILLEPDGLTGAQGHELLDSLWRDYEKHPFFMIDTQEIDPGYLQDWVSRLTLEGVRQRISDHMGDILKALVDRGADSRMILVGGDTLLVFLEKLNIREIVPLRELLPGVVLTRVSYKNSDREVISKSGGFGGADLFTLLRGEETPDIQEADKK